MNATLNRDSLFQPEMIRTEPAEILKYAGLFSSIRRCVVFMLR